MSKWSTENAFGKACIVGEISAKSLGQNMFCALCDDQKCRSDREYIFPKRTRRDLVWTTRAERIYSAVVAVADRNCSRLSTSHPCCISPQTLIRTNRTRVHALRNTEWSILREGACEQRAERDPRTDTFYSDVLFRARCFIRWTERAMFSFNPAFISL